MSAWHINNCATEESDVVIEDPDLEDGEIDDDDDEDLQIPTPIANTNEVNSGPLEDKNTEIKSVDRRNMQMVTIDLVNDSGSHISPLSLKSKKPQLVEDDHASIIENAIATALKKKGIDPPIPKILESRSEKDRPEAEQVGTGYGQSRSSRRRKRKKQRDEKEKEKERKDKKRHRFESPFRVLQKSNSSSQPTPVNEEDFDDYEMLNVRGGSPPPGSKIQTVVRKDHYDSGDESATSYDSFDSQHRYENRRLPIPTSGNKSRESRKSRRERARAREDCDDRNGRGGEKRNRRDSANDDKQHRQEPRKLELCKFYLMECCAKKDKCSYMHSDFPCKYYYLGMECVFGSSCKFSHGKPLTEQLRNILLKHLETAPKEILGNFKRICRDTAIAQMAVRHSELCKEFGVENSLTSMTNNSNNPPSSRGSNSGSTGDHHHHNQQQQQSQSSTGIPSLLDIVIKPPTGTPVVGPSASQSQQKDKQRKSRWCDTNKTKSIDKPIASNSANAIEPPTNNASSYLELNNLTGILSADHIEKLAQLGVVNLEQVYQLTFAQLNKIGLTIAEISEIQVKAINMAKLGLNSSSDTLTTTISNVSNAIGKPLAEKISSSRDVDMRFLPSATSPLASVVPTNQATSATELSEKIVSLSSNSNSNSSVVLVDYSQYLKDSNLFVRGDFLDDEKDEEQLVIDDENNDECEEVMETETNECADSTAIERVQLSDMPLIETLKNPFSDSPLNNSNDIGESRDPRSQPDGLESIQNATSFLSMSKCNSFRDNPNDNSSECVREIQTRDEPKEYFNIRSSRSRSRSETPTRCSQSTSPESRSPVPPVYERRSMYDFNYKNVDEDSTDYLKSAKYDKDMRLHRFQDSANSDIDLRLPFQPVTNYTPATEIDASITSHLPVTYKVYVVDVPKPNYGDQRQTSTSDQTNDPRLRRILGLPELSKTNTAVALSRALQSSSSIASPESETSFNTSTNSLNTVSSYTARKEDRDIDVKDESKMTTSSGLRQDPRRAAAASANIIPNPSTAKTVACSVAQKQNMEIRNLLQKSEWYKNLNSNFKIMVNQQLALVSTELKKFHQDPSTDKIFNIQFIVNNPYLQRILTNLEIYIDDNGEVAYIENEQQQHGNLINSSGNNILPNLNQMPPNMQQQQQQQQHHQQHQQMDFLRGPPPGLPNIGNIQNTYSGQMGSTHPAQHMGLPAFSGGSLHGGIMSNTRPSLLGMPPVNSGNNPFNPFTNVAMLDINNVNFASGPVGGMLGGPAAYGNFSNAPGLTNAQRNFSNQRHNRNRRANNNYGNKGGVGGNKQ